MLLRVAWARGIAFDTSRSSMLWFLAACSLFTVGMYGAAATLAARVPHTEEYIGRVPVIAIVPLFVAGSLFPIGALPVGLTWLAQCLPLPLARPRPLRDALRPERPARDLAHADHHRHGNPQPHRRGDLRRTLTAIAVRVFSRTAVS